MSDTVVSAAECYSHWSTVGGMAAIPGGRPYGMNGAGSSVWGGNTGNAGGSCC